jgi:uncharacterized protein YerC
MKRQLNIQVSVTSDSVFDDIDTIESVQVLVDKLTVANLKVLAEKSKKPGINKKIQTYKKFM